VEKLTSLSTAFFRNKPRLLVVSAIHWPVYWRQNNSKTCIPDSSLTVVNIRAKGKVINAA